jgi:hypothetical protein
MTHINSVMHDSKLSRRLKPLKSRLTLEAFEDFLWLCHQVDEHLWSNFLSLILRKKSHKNSSDLLDNDVKISTILS